MRNLFYTSKRHEHHFKNEVKYIEQKNSRLVAAVYLLTADKGLWEQCRNHINRNDIDFENFHPEHMSLNAYTFYQVAKDLMRETRTVSIGDLVDEDSIPYVAIKVVACSLGIVRPYPFKKCTSILERSWW